MLLALPGSSSHQEPFSVFAEINSPIIDAVCKNTAVKFWIALRSVKIQLARGPFATSVGTALHQEPGQRATLAWSSVWWWATVSGSSASSAAARWAHGLQPVLASVSFIVGDGGHHVNRAALPPSPEDAMALAICLAHVVVVPTAAG